MSSLARLRAPLDRLLDKPAVFHGLVIAGIVFIAWMMTQATPDRPLTGYDAHAYYDAASLDDPYRETIRGGFDQAGGLYEYKYPPPFAQLLFPLHVLPWPVFLGLWLALLYASFLWMAGRWSLLLLLFPPLLGELLYGNLNLLLGAAVVLGFRWPAAWAFILLTKITPGIGLLWFVVRRDWRSLAIALGATAAIVAVSFVLAPGLWSDFMLASQTQTGATLVVPRQAIPVNLPIRLAAAAAIVAYAAWSDRRWLVPIAVAISVPFLWWNVLAILVACIPLARRERRSTTASASLAPAPHAPDPTPSRP
ncbi:MAG TPA: glycosyltransferase family 87 protein [Candidatus Limnocylindrales bacterium]